MLNHFSLVFTPWTCSLPGSSVPRILRARILEWFAIPFSRGSSQPRDRTRVSLVSCFGRQVLYHWHHLGSPWPVLPIRKLPQALSIRGQTELKTTITENEPNWSHGSQPCVTQWSYEPGHEGPPKTDRPRWRVMTKHGPVEKGMVNHFSILALWTQWTVCKGKKIWHKRWTPQVGRGSVCYWKRVETYFQKKWRGWVKVETMPSCGCVWWWN